MEGEVWLRVDLNGMELEWGETDDELLDCFATDDTGGCHPEKPRAARGKKIEDARMFHRVERVAVGLPNFVSFANTHENTPSRRWMQTADLMAEAAA